MVSANKRYLTGNILLDRKIKQLKMTGSRRVLTAGMRKQAQHLAKVVKKDVPSRYKSVRKAIGWRSLELKRNKGEPGTKVGGGVGKRKGVAATREVVASFDRMIAGRPGDGISSANIHWWIQGTDVRTTGTKRVGRTKQRVDTGGKKMNRGSMPPQMPPIKAYAVKHQSTLKSILVSEAKKALKKEAAKLRAKARGK